MVLVSRLVSRKSLSLRLEGGMVVSLGVSFEVVAFGRGVEEVFRVGLNIVSASWQLVTGRSAFSISSRV